MLCRGSWRMLKAGCRRCMTPTPASFRSKRSVGNRMAPERQHVAQQNPQGCALGIWYALTGIHAWHLLHN